MRPFFMPSMDGGYIENAGAIFECTAVMEGTSKMQEQFSSALQSWLVNHELVESLYP
jgi:hypothetical protein